MPPTIHCVRHAQGFHNLTPANHVMPDPMLTEHGENQCRALQEKFPFHDEIELIVASPLRRTLYTALLSFENIIKKKNLTIIALPELQETSQVPCDVGSDLEVLQKEVEEKELPVDLSLLTKDWNIKDGKYAPFTPEISARAREARNWLKARPEKSIAVVTHGGFLHYFTEDWQDSVLYQGTGWANTEFRSYTFRPGVNDEDLLGKKVGGDNAPLVETEASRLMRGKEVEAPSRELQCQFFNQAITGWNNQNAQNLKDLEDEDAAKHKETVDVVDAGEKVQKVIEISD